VWVNFDMPRHELEIQKLGSQEEVDEELKRLEKNDDGGGQPAGFLGPRLFGTLWSAGLVAKAPSTSLPRPYYV